MVVMIDINCSPLVELKMSFLLGQELRFVLFLKIVRILPHFSSDDLDTNNTFT